MVPGTLVDPEPGVLQDSNLNSPFIIKLTRGGVAAANVAVEWSVDDSTARIQSAFARTDEQGLARAWLFAGTGDTQTVLARASGVSATYTVRRSASTPRTVGRYVTLYLDAPVAARQVDAVRIGVTARSSPPRTYYQLLSAWTAAGSMAFYGGLQQLPCTNPSEVVLPEACDPSRGKSRGKIALFSMWDEIGQDGSRREPTPVSLPIGTMCQRFGHEGDGLQCMASFDWRVKQRIEWMVRKVRVNADLTAIIEVTASVDGGLHWHDIGTFELPREPQLGSIAVFNENWGGAPASTCQQVSARSMTINRAQFGVAGEWYSAQGAVAAGGEYPGALPCENYEVVAERTGIRMTSGGSRTWVNMRDAALYEAAALPLGMGFPSADHA
ncbi:MAG: DUF3472 domain-containing protein, partial [bacterium]